MTVHKNFIDLALLQIIFVSVSMAASNESGKVLIHATDQFGTGLGPIQVTKFVEPRIGGRDYAVRFVGPEADGIPYGDYVVQIRAGSSVRGGRIHIDRPATFVVLSGSGVILDFAPNAKPITREK